MGFFFLMLLSACWSCQVRVFAGPLTLKDVNYNENEASVDYETENRMSVKFQSLDASHNQPLRVPQEPHSMQDRIRDLGDRIRQFEASRAERNSLPVSENQPEFEDTDAIRVFADNNVIIEADYDTLAQHKESPRRRLPDAIIIGVKKAGTRALLEFLRIHPDVRAPGPEPHFFDRNYDRGYEWYRNEMPATLEGQLTMEKTPSYFITKEAPGRMRKMNPALKLVLVARDPVTRAISDYTQALSKRDDVRPFEDLAFVDNSTGLVDVSWGAIKIGLYAKHLERWLGHFPRSQLHIVSGERLIEEPAKEMAKVQAFLGLKNVINEKHFYFNSTKGFPCLKKPENSGSPHCLGRTKGRPHPYINPVSLERLRTFFRPFNQKFYQMTGIDFGWD